MDCQVETPTNSSKQNEQSEIKHDRMKSQGIWATVIPVETPSNYLSPDQNAFDDENNDQPPEARAWSTYQSTNVENVLGEGPTRQQKALLTSGAAGQQRLKDARGVEHVLSYIDRRRPPRHTKYRFTWRTFLGTMSGMEQVYARDDFLRYYEEFRPCFIFMDSVFRGIAQVMFANNALSGMIITIGLFIGNWELALYGLLGTSVSTLTAHVLGFAYDSIRAGLYGYNGCLTAMGISYFNFSHSPQIIGPVVVMCIFSTIFAMAISKILVQRLELSPFTFSFQICTWIWLLGSLKFRYFFVDGSILSPHLLSTFVDKPTLSNVTFPTYTAQDNFVGFLASIAQVYFIDNPITGAIIIVGVCVCSRILAFFALFGAVTAQLVAAYLLGLPSTTIHAGLWGFNSVLTCQALGGMFFVLYGYRIWFFTLFASVMTVLLQAAVSAFLSPAGMPTLTFPFTAICWIFCLIAGSKNLIAVKLTAVSIPEDHYRRFRLSRLVKTQFQLISHLTNLSSTYDEDITWEELSRLKEIVVPVLMCSHVYHNDMTSLKLLIRQQVNIHSTDQNLRSPLHISASQGNMQITKWLVESLKMNVNMVDKFGGTPLFDAFWHGHFHLLAYLYAHGARLPSIRSKELAFYLNAFVYEGNLEALEFLISCGFNPNTSDYDGRNALHIAVITNQFDIVRYLVEEFSVCANIADYFRQRPLDYALRLPDLTIANYLLSQQSSNPVDPNSDKKKSRRLEVIVERYLDKQAQREDLEKESQKESDAVNGNNTTNTNVDEKLLPTLFSLIIAQKNMSNIEDFLQEYPQLNILDLIDYDFRSVAHVAAAEGRLEVIRLLFEKCQPADFERIVNREDRWKVSPLDEAYQNGHNHIVQFITDHTNLKTNLVIDGGSHSTEIDVHSNVTVRLLHKWKKRLLFCTLASCGAAERIRSLFVRGYFRSNEIYSDYHQRNPMHFAAANGQIDVIKVLIQIGYEGAVWADRWGNYPVDEAKQKDFPLIVDELTRLKV